MMRTQIFRDEESRNNAEELRGQLFKEQNNSAGAGDAITRNGHVIGGGIPIEPDGIRSEGAGPEWVARPGRSDSVRGAEGQAGSVGRGVSVSAVSMAKSEYSFALPIF
jgi:hypothetical protein